MGTPQLPDLDADSEERMDGSVESDLSGQNLGQYQLLECVGWGNMCAVYKAYQPGLDRHVAVKVLPSHFSGDTLLVARFQREARAIARLTHPNILQVYDVGQQGDLAYIVMQYIEGGTLKSLLGRPLPLGRAVEIVSQVASALEEAHRHDIVHRDVKPSNVLLARPDWVLLSDFGLARMLKASVRLTESGVTVGTPAYMSPEQGRGERAEPRSDIYSLGVVLFEMLTGILPYDDRTPMSVVVKHITAPVPRPSELNPDISASVERVIMQALAKDPFDRYESAQKFALALQAAAAETLLSQRRPVALPITDMSENRPGGEEIAPPAGPDQIRSRATRRLLAPAVVVALAVLVSIIAMGGGLWKLGSAPPENAGSEQNPTSAIALGLEPAVMIASSTSAPGPQTLTFVARETLAEAPVSTYTPDLSTATATSTSAPTGTATPNWPATVTAQAEMLAAAVAATLTAQPTATSMPAPPTATPTLTNSPTSMPTATATPTYTPAPPTPNWPATVTAQADMLAMAVAATLTAQPTATSMPAPPTATPTLANSPAPMPTATATPTSTPAPPTPDWAATVTAQANMLAMAVAATLTAQPTVTDTPIAPTFTPAATETLSLPTDTPTQVSPTVTPTMTETPVPPTATHTAMPTMTETLIPSSPTPDWPATVTAQAQVLETAIALVLVAQASPTALDTSTPTPSATPTLTHTTIPPTATTTPTATLTPRPSDTPASTVTPTGAPPTPTLTASPRAPAGTEETAAADTRNPGATRTTNLTPETSPTPVTDMTEAAGLYTAPALLNPGHGFATGDGQVNFEWSWDQELGQDECFELVMSGSLEGPFWGAVACMKERGVAFNILQASHIKPGPAGQYFWTVRVNRELPEGQWITVSATAEPRELRVSAGGGGGGSASGGGHGGPAPP